MKIFNSFSQVCKLVLIATIFQGSLTLHTFASSGVGSVISIKGVISVQPANGNAYFLAKDSPVFEGDTISSTKKSFVVLGFVDKSKVVVKQESIFKVEGFRYGTENDESTFSLLKGGIRAVSGTIAKNNPDNYKVNTAVVALGVRGTAYDAQICEGECLTKSKQGGNKNPVNPQNDVCKVRLTLKKLKAGAYFKVREGEIVLDNGREQISLTVGDVGFADDQNLGCLSETPEFMIDDVTPLPESDDFRKFSPLQCSA